MKILKKILYMLIAASFCFIFAAVGFASEEGPRLNVDAVKDSAVFVNRKTDTKGLVISKKVVNSSGTDNVHADIEFTFSFELNGEIGENVVYVLYGSDGKEIKKYYDKGKKEYHNITEDDYKKIGADWFEVERKTNASGEFRLKAGENAVFTGLSIGDSYKVKEIDIPKNFVQITPASGNAVTGVVDSDDNSAEFVNRYTPERPEEETQTINVTKKIISAKGYDTADEDILFSFNIQLGGKPWADKPYIVYDVSTGKVIRVSDNTDEYGNFKLKANENAVFEAIPKYQKYIITELETEGWWCVGKDTYTGNVGNSEIFADFTNSKTSFGVKKSMNDGSVPDKEFTFILTDEKGASLSDIKYYIYDENGKLVYAEPRFTDAFGQFFVSAKQTAIFEGIPYGTIYNVKEKASPGFIQISPVSHDGYIGMKVEAVPVILQFTNEVEEITGSLTVTKNVLSEGVSVDDDAEFAFVLLDKNDTPVANMLFSVDSKTFRTDTEGIFILKSGQTAIFERLVIGREYAVRELGAVLGDGSFSMDDYRLLEDVQQSGKLTDIGLSFVYNNYYDSVFDFSIIKVDKQYPDTVLSGAVFRLEKLDELNNIDDSFTVVEVTTGANGIATFNDLVSGKYMLTEVQSPVNYYKLKDPVIIVISLKDGTVTRSDKTGDDAIVPLNENMPVENDINIILPASGSNGMIWLLLTAFVLMGSSLAVFCITIRRKKTY